MSDIFAFLNIDHIDLTHPLILCILVLLGIQLLYFSSFYIRLLFHKDNTVNDQDCIPLSVVVTARNEADNLRLFLPRVLEQDYPDFEVIVINDASTDNSEEVLYELSQHYKRLRVSSVPEDSKFTHGKKLAITLGVKAATHEHIVFIDADCYPVTDQWLKYMSSKFSEKTDIVLGYGGYASRSGLLDKYIRSDTFSIAKRYLGFALAGVPYMGVGRNLAYKKTLFMSSKGFAKHVQLFSGDDDLFVNEMATRNNTSIAIDKHCHTRSIQMGTIGEWIQQKRRHLTTGPLYRPIHQMLLGFEMLVGIFFYAAIAAALYSHVAMNLVFLIICLKVMFQAVYYKIIMNRLQERNLLLFLFIHDIISPYVNSILAGLNYTRKKNTWN